MKIRDHAHGEWSRIIGALLGEELVNKRKHQACPSTGECGKGAPRFRFSDKHGNGNFFCHCSAGKADGFDLLMCVRGYDFYSACRDVESVIGPCPQDENEAKKPVEKTFAEKLRASACKTTSSVYLASRGLEVAPGLDWIKALTYVDGSKAKIGDFPAMLAPIVKNGKFLTYHATYLQDGRKAPLDPCRKILPGNESNTGGACPLYPAAEWMGIAEGVETAIAAKMIFGIPVWAALNTALLAAWEPPAGVKRVSVFGDNDANFAGHAAAYALAHKLVKKGIQVEIQIAPEVDQDWNDVLLSNRSLAA
jgi:putative DNA primase/helicase